ncbi:MAG: hypothetical protein M3463_06410, partial [Verrucomicrobiota bacterium]|nr:hypothetical protein [Verrucomicrobiota bacterium]
RVEARPGAARKNDGLPNHGSGNLEHRVASAERMARSIANSGRREKKNEHASGLIAAVAGTHAPAVLQQRPTGNGDCKTNTLPGACCARQGAFFTRKW